MTILNIMLGRHRGGIEQAAIDYAQALKLAGMDCLSIVAPGSWAQQQLQALGAAHTPLKQRSAWDPLAAWRLRQLAKSAGAKAMICHGNRALSLALVWGAAPVIAVAHNYKTKRFSKADACFAITEHARQQLAQQLPPHRIHPMPNMVRSPHTVDRAAPRTPPVIGSMGRFVPKKAFALLVDALLVLQKRNISFHAIIGGGGEEASPLQHRATPLGNAITFPGWVEDKEAFFAGLDLFILPSHHEPFGIVLIEAMAAGVPVISTASEGPREIIQSGENGLLVPLNDATALADAIASLLADPARAQAMGLAGRHTVQQRYSMQAMADRLRTALHIIITGN